MQIPYTTEIRPDTGVTNPKLGIWLFLASEVMLFGSLFSAYALLRSGAEAWPDQSAVLSVPLATLNTVILISSSVTMVLSWAALKARDIARYRLHMGLTLLLGASFLVVKAFEYEKGEYVVMHDADAAKIRLRRMRASQATGFATTLPVGLCPARFRQSRT